MRTAYRCRTYPDAEQQQVLARTFGCIRVVWNRTLAARHARWERERKGTSYVQADAALTVMKKDPGLRFLTEVSSVPLQQALRHQHKAFTAFFEKRAAGMVRNRRLARAISDCGWGEFRRQLVYKCQRYGRTLVVIDRFCPSTKTCSACGHRLAQLSLNARTWQCPSCGARHDRDINAAKNILAAGQAVTACGAGVRHSGSSRVRPAVNQEVRPARVGIPVLMRAAEQSINHPSTGA
jgi:transposase